MNISYDLSSISQLLHEEEAIKERKRHEIKTLLKFTIDEISAAVKNVAGQKVVVLIQGSYDMRIVHEFGKGWRTTPISFKEVFIGIISSPTEGLITSEETSKENYEIPVTQLIEMATDFPLKFSPVKDGRLFLHKPSWRDEPGWNIADVLFSHLPVEMMEKLIGQDFGTRKNASVQLLIGNAGYDQYLKSFGEAKELAAKNEIEKAFEKTLELEEKIEPLTGLS